MISALGRKQLFAGKLVNVSFWRKAEIQTDALPKARRD
jgi:hypothetical protein